MKTEFVALCTTGTDEPSPCHLIIFLFSYPPIYAYVFQVVSFPQVSLPKPYMHLSSYVRATCPAHVLMIDVITWIIFPHYIIFSNL